MADEYTPTTAEIRKGYIGEPEHFMDPLVGAEFDRWLAEHDREVRADQWDEAFVQGAVWRQSDLTGVPDDPPPNPYREGLDEARSAEVSPPSPRRLRSCVEQWPDAETGAYNPSCCRFPKSCSATVYSEEHVTDADLEPLREEVRDA